MNAPKFTGSIFLLFAALAAGCNTTSVENTASSTAEKAAPTPAASTATASAPAVPTAFPDPPNEKKSLEVSTKDGKQIYTCGPKKDDATQFAWSLKAPEAELTDSKGYKVGKHYGTPNGPAWESTDGSKVIGDRDKVQSIPAPNAIPWLLLPAKSIEGKAVKGVFSAVKSIQRLNTEGGKAPETGCDKANVGKEVRVDYKATYYFYETKLK